MSNTVRQLIQQWVHVSPEIKFYGFNDNSTPAISRANFLGTDASDPGANGENIYSNPQNLPTAVACILNQVQNRADFHPATQSAAVLSSRFNNYIAELNKTPYFYLNQPITRVSKQYETKDYNVLFNDIVNVYKNITESDKKAMKESIAEMARSVFEYGSAEAWKGLFTQSTIDYQDANSPRFFVYYTQLHMKYEEGKSEVVLQEFTVTGYIYTVLADLIRSSATTLAGLEKKTVDDWMSDNVSKENTSFLPCFKLDPYNQKSTMIATNFTLNTFTQAIINWANHRNNTFRYNWVVKGGWEGWVQVDLVAHILSVDTTYDILREQAVYTNTRKKADLLLNANLPTGAQIPVEIKAQSWYNRAGFLPGVEEDLNKLEHERNFQYAHSSCVMFGIAFEQGALDGMLAIRRQGHTIFRTIYFDGEIAICMATWTQAYGWGQVNSNNNSKFKIH